MATPPFDLNIAHRWFAVEFNNTAWDLVEADQRSPEQTERMIHAAHAACLHWLSAGNLLNHLRAQCLLATVYAKAGIADSAVRHAERCLSLSLEAGATQNAWDLATAHGCASVAYQLAGRAGPSKAEYELAKAAAVGFGDASEMILFDRFYPAP